MVVLLPRFQETCSITVLIPIAQDSYQKMKKLFGMSLGRDREQGHPHHLNQDPGQQQEQDHHQHPQEGGGLPDPDPGHHRDHQEGGGEPPPASWRAGGSPAPGGCLCPTPGLGQRSREGEEGGMIIIINIDKKHV